MAQRILILLILLLTGCKLFLIGEGFMTFPDENRYIPAGWVLERLATADLKGAANALNCAQGRPGDVLIKTIPAAVQFATAELTGMETYQSQNFYPLFIFNFLVYCLTLFMVFKIGVALLKDRVAALCAVVLYCCLVNSYIYLRHTLPYDESLLLYCIVLYHILKTTLDNTFSNLKMLALGFTAFFAHLVYPGFIMLFAMLFGILLCNKPEWTAIWKRIKFAAYYTAGSVFCLLLFEAISRPGGTSYIKASVTLSNTISQGSFNEGYSFLFKYLLDVEGVTGAILITGCIAAIAVASREIITQRRLNSIVLVITFLVILFLVYSGTGYFLHKMVWYGRLLHQFYFLLPIFTIWALQHIKNARIKVYGGWALVTVFIAVFTFNLAEYKRYAYPKDVAWALIKDVPTAKISGYCEYPPHSDMLVYLKLKTNPDNFPANYLITNSCFYYPFIDGAAISPFKNGVGQAMFSKPYFHNYSAYLYEGCSIEERELYRAANLQVQVYKLSE